MRKYASMILEAAGAAASAPQPPCSFNTTTTISGSTAGA